MAAKTMAELLAKSKQKLASFSVGQKVKARVAAETPEALILDIGGKSEGVVTGKAFTEAKDYIKTLKVGDEVSASVIVAESREGNVVLSLRQAMYSSLWDSLEKAKDSQEPVAVVARGINPAGVTVEAENLSGFIPSTQLGKEAAKNPQSLVGKYFKAVVIEVDRNQNKLVLSEKEVSDAKDIKEAREALAKIKEGEIFDGVVTTVANFGCFVKIPSGIEGLVHISELAWGRVGKTSDVVAKGEKVKVKVIGKRDGKLALSIKQAKEDPWTRATKNYQKDTKIVGKVVRISDFGVFVELEPGIEGLIHMTNIPPATKLTEGQEVKCYVQDIDTKAKKLSLGLVLSAKPIGYK